jgi:hypothetical protein
MTVEDEDRTADRHAAQLVAGDRQRRLVAPPTLHLDRFTRLADFGLRRVARHPRLLLVADQLADARAGQVRAKRGQCKEPDRQRREDREQLHAERQVAHQEGASAARCRPRRIARAAMVSVGWWAL